MIILLAYILLVLEKCENPYVLKSVSEKEKVIAEYSGRRDGLSIGYELGICRNQDELFKKYEVCADVISIYRSPK